METDIEELSRSPLLFMLTNWHCLETHQQIAEITGGLRASDGAGSYRGQGSHSDLEIAMIHLTQSDLSFFTRRLEGPIRLCNPFACRFR